MFDGIGLVFASTKLGLRGEDSLKAFIALMFASTKLGLRGGRLAEGAHKCLME